MAKVSARGAHKVAGFRVEIPDSETTHGTTWYYKFALRSDGKVLRAVARKTVGLSGSCTNGGTYKVLGEMKAGRDATAEDLERWLVRKYGAERVTRSSN